MSQIALEAAARDRAGKGVARTLRREGRIPAVIYGDSKEPIMISLPSNKLNLEYRKGHMRTSLFNLSVGSVKHLVLARDIALHPVKDTIEHIDFLRVSGKTRVTVAVPVHVIGQDNSPGIKKKGIVSYSTHEIQLDCQATSIPEFIEVDISALDMGDVLHMSDVKLPKDTHLSANISGQTLLSIENPDMGAEPEPTAPVAADVPAAKVAADADKKADDKK